MFRNVMVPVDGSSFSREAVLQGLRLASRFGATLRLVRVASTTVFAGAPDGSAVADIPDFNAHAGELADLYAIAAECRAHSTINVTASLERGPVVDALCGYAHRNSVDLIVMRSHTRTGLARVWFGSIADSLIRQSGIPVLVVRPPSVATGIENGATFRKIVVPLDGSVLAEQALPHAIALARLEGATILLLFVVAPFAHGALTGPLSSLGRVEEDHAAAIQAYLDNVIVQSRARVPVSTRIVVSSNAATAILQAAEADEADLITLSSRGRGALARSIGGSVSDFVMTESTISTLVVHPVVASLSPPGYSAPAHRVAV